MFSAYLVLELDTGKRLLIELERGVGPSSLEGRIDLTNGIKYQGKEKIVKAYIAKATTEDFENILQPVKEIEVKGEKNGIS